MTNSDKAEDSKVDNSPEDTVGTDNDGAYHPLSQELRTREATPPSDLNEGRVPVLTNSPNAQHIHTEKEKKKVSTILEDIAEINAMFGE